MLTFLNIFSAWKTITSPLFSYTVKNNFQPDPIFVDLPEKFLMRILYLTFYFIPFSWIYVNLNCEYSSQNQLAWPK